MTDHALPPLPDLPPLRFPEMKLPEFPRVPVPYHPGTLTLTPEARDLLLRLQDPSVLEGIRQGFRQIGEAVQRLTRNFNRGLTAVGRAVVEAHNNPVHVTGMCSQYAVRAGLDPQYADEARLSGLIRGVIRGELRPGHELRGMTRENRIQVAVAALRAHAVHRPAPAYVITFGGYVEHHIIRQHTFTVRSGR